MSINLWKTVYCEMNILFFKFVSNIAHFFLNPFDNLRLVLFIKEAILKSVKIQN